MSSSWLLDECIAMSTKPWCHFQNRRSDKQLLLERCISTYSTHYVFFSLDPHQQCANNVYIQNRSACLSPIHLSKRIFQFEQAVDSSLHLSNGQKLCRKIAKYVLPKTSLAMYKARTTSWMCKPSVCMCSPSSGAHAAHGDVMFSFCWLAVARSSETIPSHEVTLVNNQL